MNIDNKWVNSTAKWVLQDGANLKFYLQTISACPDYSINNQLLLMYQSQSKPFTMIKSQDAWQEQGVSINPEAAAFTIWEPDKDDNGEVILAANGKEPAGYHYKYMYDAADTDYSYVPEHATSEQALEALLTNLDVPVVVVDEIKNVAGVRAMYVPKDKTIYVVRSGRAPADEFFTAIATEMGHAFCHSQQKDTAVAYNRAQYHFTCCSAAYAVATHHGVKTDALNIDIVPDRFVQMGDRAAKNEITRLAKINRTLEGNMRMPLDKILTRDAHSGKEAVEVEKQ